MTAKKLELKKKKPVFLVCFQNTKACASCTINFVRF